MASCSFLPLRGLPFGAAYLYVRPHTTHVSKPMSIFAELPQLPGTLGPEDALFSTQEDWWNTACLNWTSSGWTLYASGYKEAADALVERLESKASGQDTLVYPILFLYRQYIELQLKLTIRTCRHLLEDGDDFPTGHRIDRLWGELDKLLRQAFPDESTTELDQTGRLISEFAKVDPLSTAFRYPVDKDGDASLPGIKYINLRNVREVLAKMAMLLDGAQTLAYERLQWKLEMEREMQENYR
jgi:hypothetical protein